jgi:hypothetical protein
MNTIAADTVFTVEAGNEINMVPDGCMIYQPSRERVHYLNPTAVVVYELAGAGRNLAAIEEFLREAYALREAPRREVMACLEMLVAEGLVSPCPPSSSAP